MNPDRQQARDYLCAPANGLWRWAEDGGVLVWRDGTTIAFREEILQILEWLAPNGLPPFGALVLLLAACRGKVPTPSDIVPESDTALPTAIGQKAGLLLSARKQLQAQIEAALEQLRKVAQLPAELNTGIRARCVLAEAVFEPVRAERYVDARAVLRGLGEGLRDFDLLDPERAVRTGNYLHQVHLAAEGLKLRTPESLALRLRTGLDALPGQVDTQLPSAERARRLIEELSRDPEYGSVARAARELMAAVRLPRRLGERDQLALGGVADITNRGPLDRLLLSELAHDDLTLSVRVALNEALYLRREPPMREPPGSLALLLDSGVRLWGVPRVLATAVALALIGRDQHHAQVRAWRSKGTELTPVDLLSRQGLEQHLGALETAAHPGACLRAFAAAVPPGVENQSVLITHPDTWNDLDFRRALAKESGALGFVALVDREGRFELHALPASRRPPLCQANLDLDSVFAKGTRVGPIRVEVDPSLPAIFGVQPFPLLLPIAGRVDFWTKASDGFTYAVLSDRRLVQYRDHRSGARLLSSDLPGGRTLWMHYADGTVHVVKSGTSQHPARLMSLPLAEGRLRVLELAAGGECYAVQACGQVILLLRNTDVRAYALSDGRMLGRILNPHKWFHGRFFRGQSHFYFATWDGGTVRLEAVTLPADCAFQDIATIFDREGLEGPWVLHTSGCVVSTATGERISLNMPVGFPSTAYNLACSRDGHRLHLLTLLQLHKWGGLYDLQTGRSTQDPQWPGTEATLNPRPPLPVWNLFRVIEAIAPLPDGLVLFGRHGRARKLVLGQGQRLRIQDGQDLGRDLHGRVAFKSQAKPAPGGCSLQLAQWPCGSKAYLDNRGLLHLKSHDPNLPELSLVLSHGEVAGWSSDGCVCGPPFFFEDQHLSDPEGVFTRLLPFLQRL